MKYIVVLLCVLALALNSLAGEWRPFVGIATNGDIVTPFYHFDFHNSCFLPTTFAYAGTVRAGLKRNNLSFYAGYHLEDAPVLRQRDHWYRYRYDSGEEVLYSLRKDYQWDISWVELGIRWEPAYEEKQPIRPTLGAALAMSETQLYEQYTNLYQDETGGSVPYNSRGSRRTSKADVGIIGEFGMEIDVARNVTFEMLARLHRYEAEFERRPEDARLRHYVTLVPMLDLGLSYRLPIGF